jgi:hypothetical protein
MAVAFSSADSSISTRQLLKELDYLYQYDSTRHAYVSKSSGGTVVPGNCPFLVFLQSENDLATGAFFPIEANIVQNHPDYSFYTSEHNPGNENRYCHNGTYNPDLFPHSTGKELWRRWQFVRTGNDRVPVWIVRVPKDIIWGHGGLWSDNSVAMLAALFRMQFPLTTEGATTPPPVQAPSVPVLTQ